VAAVGLATALLSGCAQPGQLGSPLPAPAVDPALVAPAAAPSGTPLVAPPGGAVLLSSGLVDDPVSVRTTGPAEFAVHTVVLPAGENTGWHRHPGTEMSIVRSGAVTVQRADACDPAIHPAGDGVFVADGEPHIVRNDGPVPAELVVTSLLAPAAPDSEDVPPAC
jgi:quercetin dioxygenase-like cupin family protein